MLVKTDLHMAGNSEEQQLPVRKRMLDAAAAIPSVTAVGYSERLPLSIGGGDFWSLSCGLRLGNLAVTAQSLTPRLTARIPSPSN